MFCFSSCNSCNTSLEEIYIHMYIYIYIYYNIYNISIYNISPSKTFFLTYIYIYIYIKFNQGCYVFIQYNLLKGCCEWILMQSWNQVIHYGLTWRIRLRIGISHLSISGLVVHGRSWYFPLLLFFCYILFFSYLFMIFCWLIFVFCFGFMSLDSSLSNQEFILTCLLSF